MDDLQESQVRDWDVGTLQKDKHFDEPLVVIWTQKCCVIDELEYSHQRLSPSSAFEVCC